MKDSEHLGEGAGTGGCGMGGGSHASAAWHMSSITVHFQTFLQDLWHNSLHEKED